MKTLLAIREYCPKATLTLVVEEGLYELCRGWTFLDQCIKFISSEFIEKVADNSRIRIRTDCVKAFFDSLSKENYDFVVNLGTTLLSALFTNLINIRCIGLRLSSSGVSEIHGNVMLLASRIKAYQMLSKQHRSDLTQDRVLFNIKNTTTEQYATEYFGQDKKHISKKNDARIIIAPGGVECIKRWPTSYFSELIKVIYHALGERVYVLGYTAETHEIFNSLDSANIPYKKIQTPTLASQLQIIQRCSCIVGNDTGILHVGAAFGKKIIGIFGPTEPEISGCLGNGSMFLKTISFCSPCFFQSGCVDPYCMSEIKPSHILELLKLQLHYSKKDYSYNISFSEMLRGLLRDNSEFQNVQIIVYEGKFSRYFSCNNYVSKNVITRELKDRLLSDILYCIMLEIEHNFPDQSQHPVDKCCNQTSYLRDKLDIYMNWMMPQDHIISTDLIIQILEEIRNEYSEKYSFLKKKIKEFYPMSHKSVTVFNGTYSAEYGDCIQFLMKLHSIIFNGQMKKLSISEAYSHAAIDCLRITAVCDTCKKIANEYF